MKVASPTEDETIQILKGLAPRYEEFHRVRYAPEALEGAAKLSDRHLHDRKRQPAEAEAAYRTVVTDFSETPSLTEAEVRLAEMTGGTLAAPAAGS